MCIYVYMSVDRIHIYIYIYVCIYKCTCIDDCQYTSVNIFISMPVTSVR